MNKPEFGKVVIYGVGLMGGSLGLALQKREVTNAVWGLGRNEARLKAAVDQGVLTHGTVDPEEAFNKADVVVVGLPILHLSAACLKAASLAPPSCLVTDMGSTKSEIVTSIEAALTNESAAFVGSHPMCGSERTGFEAGKPDLFEAATCVVTTTAQTHERDLKKAETFWQAVGGKTVRMTPAEHDRLAAETSHMPRLTAAALCLALAEEMEAEKRDQMVATGFLGASRTAAADVDNWLEIVRTNEEYVLQALGLLQGNLTQIQHAISRQDYEGLEQMLHQAADFRRELSKNVPLARRRGL